MTVAPIDQAYVNANFKESQLDGVHPGQEVTLTSDLYGSGVVFHGHVLHGAAGRDDYAQPRRAFASLWGGPDLRCHRPDGFAMPTIGEFDGHRAPHGARIGDHPEEFPFYFMEVQKS